MLIGTLSSSVPVIPEYGICKPTLVFGRSPAGVLKLGTCISFHVFCMAFPACIFARFSMCTSFAWCSACMHELNMCRAAVHHFPLAAALLTASFFILFIKPLFAS